MVVPSCDLNDVETRLQFLHRLPNGGKIGPCAQPGPMKCQGQSKNLSNSPSFDAGQRIFDKGLRKTQARDYGPVVTSPFQLSFERSCLAQGDPCQGGPPADQTVSSFNVFDPLPRREFAP